MNNNLEGKYTSLWKIINTDKFEKLKKHQILNSNFPGKVTQYFTETSEYKVFNLQSIISGNVSYPELSDVSIEALSSILVFDCRDDKEKKRLESSDVKFKRDRNFHLRFQETMLIEGHLSLKCPISQKKLTSTQSFVLGGQLIAYRFVGTEIFYVFVWGPAFKRHSIYFPSREIIIKFAGGPDPAQLVNMLKGIAVTYCSNVLNNLVYKDRRETVVTYGWMASTAHNVLNELSGIQRLCDAKLLNSVDKIIVGRFEYFGKLEEIFPEISSNKIIRIPDTEHRLLPKIALENNYWTLKIGDTRVSENLASRIQKVARQNCSKLFLSKVREAKNNFPLIMITIRTGRRFWTSQVEGLASLIQELSKKYPNLGIIFDGISRTDRDESSLSAKEIEMLKNDRAVVEAILNLIPDNSISIYNSIGCTMYESIVWANAINFYIVPFGGGMAKVTYIANKPGIVHTNHTVLADCKNQWYNASQRQNGMMPIYIPSHYISDIPESGTIPINNSYDFNWEVIYHEALKIIESDVYLVD